MSCGSISVAAISFYLIFALFNYFQSVSSINLFGSDIFESSDLFILRSISTLAAEQVSTGSC